MGRCFDKNPTDDDAFRHATVHVILRNPVYYGGFTFKGNTYHGTHAALVPRETWDRVQKALQTRPGKHRETKRNFAFTGLVTCGSCGCAITAEMKKGKYVYYRCTGFKESHRVQYTREENLTEQFAAVLADLFFDEQILDWIRVALKESHVVQRRDAEADAERFHAEHKRLEDRIHTMYVDKLDGRITADFFDAQAAECRAQQERIRRVHVENSKAACASPKWHPSLSGGPICGNRPRNHGPNPRVPPKGSVAGVRRSGPSG